MSNHNDSAPDEQSDYVRKLIADAAELDAIGFYQYPRDLERWLRNFVFELLWNGHEECESSLYELAARQSGATAQTIKLARIAAADLGCLQHLGLFEVSMKGRDIVACLLRSQAAAHA